VVRDEDLVGCAFRDYTVIFDHTGPRDHEYSGQEAYEQLLWRGVSGR
jgi:hypothetical protein